MAGAVGLAASIDGLATIASQVCKLCYDYFSDVVNVQADMKQFVSELSSLARLLEPLSQDSTISPTSDSDSILQLVQQCKKMLEKLQGELELQRQPNKRSGRMAENLRMTSLKWPFKKEDT